MASVVLVKGNLVYFFAVTAMGGTIRNDSICGYGRSIILYGLGTVYINQRKEGNF
jgi:hypothetical protein